MDKPQNIGVIGAAFFLEKQNMPFGFLPRGREGLNEIRDDPTSFKYGATTQGIGTGFGKKIEHQVERVRFEREEHAAAVLTIRYDNAEGLRSRGIIVINSHDPGDRVIEACPFPADEMSGCRPPAGWHG